MDILYACDENYLRHAAASMVSLCESHRDKPNVRLHLLSNGAKPESIAKLKDMLAQLKDERDQDKIDKQ